jgi:hypothetical protein
MAELTYAGLLAAPCIPPIQSSHGCYLDASDECHHFAHMPQRSKQRRINKIRKRT